MQDDWLDWLSMTEFVYNNIIFETTKISSFLANSEQHPRMGFEPPTNTSQPHYQAIQAWEVNEFVQTISNLKEYLKFEIKWAQAIYKFNTN